MIFNFVTQANGLQSFSDNRNEYVHGYSREVSLKKTRCIIFFKRRTYYDKQENIVLVKKVIRQCVVRLVWTARSGVGVSVVGWGQWSC